MTAKHHVHEKVADAIRRSIECVVLGNWQCLTEHEINLSIANLRTIKAQYVLYHQPLSSESLSLLDQALISLYTLLDTLQGRDVEQQLQLYQALQRAQAALLQALSRLPFPSGEEEEETDPQQEETTPSPEATGEEAVATAKRQFLWTAPMTAQLTQAFQQGLQSAPANMSVIIEAIAVRYGWPLSAVRYKLYELRLPQCYNEHVQKADLQGKKAEQRDLPAHDVPSDNLPQGEPFHWDEEKTDLLKKAFLERPEEGTRSACRAIADHYHWPVEKVTNKVHRLNLPSQKRHLLEQRNRAAVEQKDTHENELRIGPYVWRVMLDNTITQWRFWYTYGDFPDYPAGTVVWYQGKPYHLERISTQEIWVSTVKQETSSFAVDQQEQEAVVVHA